MTDLPMCRLGRPKMSVLPVKAIPYLVCPMATALEVHEAWQGSELRVVADAGHSAFEPGILEQPVTATNELGSL